MDDHLVDQLQGLANDLKERVADFPGPTCAQINATLNAINPVAREADRLERLGDDAEKRDLVEAIYESDNLLRGLPDQLEELRAMNDQLRTALHQALASRKEVAARLEALIS